MSGKIKKSKIVQDAFCRAGTSEGSRISIRLNLTPSNVPSNVGVEGVFSGAGRLGNLFFGSEVVR